MKHIRSTFFLLTTLFIMASCGEDRSGEYYALIGENVWIEQIMKEHYLWYDGYGNRAPHGERDGATGRNRYHSQKHVDRGAG